VERLSIEGPMHGRVNRRIEPTEAKYWGRETGVQLKILQRQNISSREG
jgi:hypothetical protein